LWHFLPAIFDPSTVLDFLLPVSKYEQKIGESTKVLEGILIIIGWIILPTHLYYFNHILINLLM
jgi:hypothetical protein